jgi:hypothetical protein
MYIILYLIGAPELIRHISGNFGLLKALSWRCRLCVREARARPVTPISTARLSNEFFRFSPMDFVSWFRADQMQLL